MAKSKGERIIEAAESGIARFGSDIDELRRRVVFLAAVFLVFLVAALAATYKLLPLVIKYTVSQSIQLNAFAPWDSMSIYLQFSTVIAVAAILPVALFQIWRFVAPGLTKNERSSALKYIPFALISFVIGLAFSYFVIFPSTFYFTSKVTDALGIKPTYGISEFFSYLSNILLCIAFIFELPVVTMFLTAIGVVKPEFLKKWRRYAYLVLVILGTAITPPDFISDFLATVPLIGLYEFSIALSARVYRKKLRRKNEILEDDSSEEQNSVSE